MVNKASLDFDTLLKIKFDVLYYYSFSLQICQVGEGVSSQKLFFFHIYSCILLICFGKKKKKGEKTFLALEW